MMMTRMNFRLRKYSRMLLITASDLQGMIERHSLFPEGRGFTSVTCELGWRPGSGLEEAFEPGRGEIDQEREGRPVHHRVHVAPPPADELDEAIADEARPDPVGDRVGERHHGQGQQGGKPVLEVPE